MQENKEYKLEEDKQTKKQIIIIQVKVQIETGKKGNSW